MARSLFGLSIRPVALTKFVGTVSLGLLTGLSYTTTTLTLPSLHLLPSASTASNTTHHLLTSTSKQTTYLSLLATSSLCLSYILSPRGRRHPFLLYAALTAALPLTLDIWHTYFPGSASPSSGLATGDGRINMRDISMPRHGSQSSSSAGGGDEEWECDASGMRVRTPLGSASEDGGEEVNGESVREGMRSWGQGVARRGVVWGLGFAIAVVGLWGDGA